MPRRIRPLAKEQQYCWSTWREQVFVFEDSGIQLFKWLKRSLPLAFIARQGFATSLALSSPLSKAFLSPTILKRRQVLSEWKAQLGFCWRQSDSLISKVIIVRQMYVESLLRRSFCETFRYFCRIKTAFEFDQDPEHLASLSESVNTYFHMSDTAAGLNICLPWFHSSLNSTQRGTQFEEAGLYEPIRPSRAFALMFSWLKIETWLSSKKCLSCWVRHVVRNTDHSLWSRTLCPSNTHKRLEKACCTDILTR